MWRQTPIQRIIIPTSAGVGSAVGFLRANIAYEVAKSSYIDLSNFRADTINNLFKDMYNEAKAVVSLGAKTSELKQTRTVFMRYKGQGHEIGSKNVLQLGACSGLACKHDNMQDANT